MDHNRILIIIIDIEIISLKVIVISLLYRVPIILLTLKNSYKLESLLNHLINNNYIENIYIASNFNNDLIENSSHHKEKFEFLTLIELYGFKTNFNLPTRITQNKQSCIDNIFITK